MCFPVAATTHYSPITLTNLHFPLPRFRDLGYPSRPRGLPPRAILTFGRDDLRRFGPCVSGGPHTDVYCPRAKDGSMRTLLPLPTFTLLAVFLTCAQPASAQVIGDRVIPRKIANLKVRDVVVDQAGPDEVLTVEQVQDAWLWVRTPIDAFGWVKRADVRLESEAPAPAGMPRHTAAASPGAASGAATLHDGERLFLIGALGGSHVYTTYGYIGVIADGVPKDTYSEEKVRELMAEVIAMNDNLVAQLAKVRATSLMPEDIEALDQMIEIYSLLREQAEALNAFTQSRTQEHANEFERLRTTVWPKISLLLGLEPQDN